MKIANLVILLFFVFKLSFSQNKNRIFQSFQKTKNGIEIIANDGEYLISFYNSNIIETTFIPTEDSSKNKSHAIVLKPVKTKFSIKEELEILSITSKGISVIIKKEPFQILYYYKDQPIISEKGGYIKNDSLEVIQFNLKEDEVLYGGGARVLGMNRRGHRLQLYNKAHYGYETRSELMNFTLPIVLSSNKYMVHFDNAPIGFLDLDSKNNNTLSYETISGRKTYQIIAGDAWLDITNHYSKLTGKQPMPPRWALGNFSSRFGYHSQKETEATIDAFIKEDIPVDAVILDLYWFGKSLKGTMGNLEVFKDSFPDFQGMTSRLKDKGVKTIVITEPFILKSSKRWKEAVQADILAKNFMDKPYTYDFYFGHTGLIDVFNPKGKEWFWNIYKSLIDKGVAGFWGDLGEPEVHPSDLKHATGSADEVHNIYGHDWAGLIHQGYQKDLPNIRPFILMRAGYSGSQRYGLIPWSGDVNRTWGGLQSQPEIALQMGMQGLAYMHSDLGGFAGDNLDDELYARWLQYGVFQPIFRPHAQEEVPSEPIFRNEKPKQLAKKAIQLRYQFLPYNYDLVFQNNQYGKPLMRPLLFEEPNNTKLFNYSKSYLWGQDILVSPVLQPHLTTQEFYFPEGTWFDFYTDEKIIGGEEKTVNLNESNIPTYVRAGAFIPMTSIVKNTENYDANTIEIHYYHDSSIKTSTRKFYNDDGKTTNAFKKENYEITIFEAVLKPTYLKITFKNIKGKNYPIQPKKITLVIHNMHNKPQHVKVDGGRARIGWNAETKSQKIPMKWDPSKEKTIKIPLKQ